MRTLHFAGWLRYLSFDSWRGNGGAVDKWATGRVHRACFTRLFAQRFWGAGLINPDAVRLKSLGQAGSCWRPGRSTRIEVSPDNLCHSLGLGIYRHLTSFMDYACSAGPWPDPGGYISIDFGFCNRRVRGACPPWA